MTATMRAIVQHAYGGPEVLQLTEVSRPEPMVTEVLVRVHAAGVNPIDAKTRAGGGFAPQMGRPPFIPGWDLSGVVVQIGYGVTRFQPGDEVYGMPNFPRRAGTYAEFVTVRSRQVARKPTSLSHVEAAALPLAGLTAWQSLVDTAQVGPGMRVLIHAAAGGVGHLAVQIAKARGAYVIGTARAAKHDFVRSLGADEVIDYTAGAFEDAVEPVEVVLDLVGGDTRRRSLEVLAQGGLLIPLPRGLDVSQEAAERGLRVAPLIVEPDYRGLEHLAELADSGRLKVSVSRELPLAQAAEAHRYIDGGGATGKTVLTVISPS
ncbi:NADP-dependent oxidoreductase [Nonomuraea turkmeniaca]|nr:NADP-dependent oxidoreductase [Nonomuraea turkmeniaca]